METEITPDKLPPAALDYIKKNYSNIKITGAGKIVNDKAVTTYEAEINMAGKVKSLLFDAGGKYLKEEKD